MEKTVLPLEYDGYTIQDSTAKVKPGQKTSSVQVLKAEGSGSRLYKAFTYSVRHFNPVERENAINRAIFYINQKLK